MNFNSSATYPALRLRRLRSAPWIRQLTAETRLSPSDLVWPIFLREPESPGTVTAMPGVQRFTLDEVGNAVAHAHQLGIPAVALFPYVEQRLKSEKAEEAYRKDNLINQGIKAIKKRVPNMGVIVDVALDPYTSHGHDGVVVNNDVDNDKTIEILIKQALSIAHAGADMVAPSDMMDGRIGAIRCALDDAGYEHVSILAYSAKFSSAFYGPFRDAVGSLNALGKSNKRTYHMHTGNARESIREISLDVSEAADVVMVKPALPYLDIIQSAAQTFPVPVFAYQVSGEYASIKAAGLNGWMDASRALWETLTSIKRAGAQAIFTYGACEVVEWMKQNAGDIV